MKIDLVKLVELHQNSTDELEKLALEHIIADSNINTKLSEEIIKSDYELEVEDGELDEFFYPLFIITSTRSKQLYNAAIDEIISTASEMELSGIEFHTKDLMPLTYMNAIVNQVLEYITSRMLERISVE